MKTLAAFIWGAVCALLLVLVAGKANAGELDKLRVTVGVGYAMSIDRPVKVSMKSGGTAWHSGDYQGRVVATVEVDYPITDRLSASYLHLSDPTWHDPGYGINALQLKVKIK